jgi:hypothetical protein
MNKIKIENRRPFAGRRQSAQSVIEAIVTEAVKKEKASV